MPFKLPSFKLPFLGKKKTEDDGDEDDRDDIDVKAADAAVASEPAAEPPASDENAETDPPAEPETDTPAAEGEGEGEDEADPSALAAMEDTKVDDSGDDDEDDDKGDEGGGWKGSLGKLLEGKKRKMIAAALGGVLIIGGAAGVFFSGGDDGEGEDQSGVPKFEMAIAPKGRASESGSLNAIIETEKGPGAGIVTSASSLMAFSRIAPPRVTDGPLPQVDGAGLIEDSHQGPLPKIAEDGRMALQVYAKSFDEQDDRPKIALIVTGLGMSEAATEAAISLLPGSVTLAFDPYAPNLQGWADKARQAGHEILIMLPLEPESFPTDDPGPQGLMTSNSTVENLLRLEYVLSRMKGYVGVVSVMGSRFNLQETQVEALLSNLKARGLLFVDGSADPKSLAPAMAEQMKLPKAFADMVLDTIPTKEAIDANLLELESVGRINTFAVALIEAYPVSIERVAAWAAAMVDKNMSLAPVSALADRQFLQ